LNLPTLKFWIKRNRAPDNKKNKPETLRVTLMRMMKMTMLIAYPNKLQIRRIRAPEHLFQLRLSVLIIRKKNSKLELLLKVMRLRMPS